MVPVIPWYITLIVLAINLTIAVAVSTILSRAAGRSGLPAAAQRRVRAGTAIFLAGWLGAALLSAPAPASIATRDPFYLTPLLPLFAVLGPTLAAVALFRSEALRRVVAAVSVPTLIGVQVYRTIGAVFVMLLALGQLPAHFALPAGWGDVAIGVTAPLVALALARGIAGGRALALTWNVVGLLDLVVAVGMGTGLLAPFLAPDLGARVAPAPAMGAFPMIIVPTFAVPVSVLLHVLALRGMARKARVESELVSARTM